MKKISILILTIFAFSSCEESEENLTNREDRVCTALFTSVKVKFIDTDGTPLIVKDYHSVNMQTNSMLKFTGAVDTINQKGVYTVASELNATELKGEGRILVSAKHPVTKVLKQAEFKVGMDFCDISKVSGPDEIRF